MNLRVFKKDIEYFVGEFIDDCALFVALNPHKDADEISNIVDEAVDLYNELKYKANHPEGKKRAFYIKVSLFSIKNLSYLHCYHIKRKEMTLSSPFIIILLSGKAALPSPCGSEGLLDCALSLPAKLLIGKFCICPDCHDVTRTTIYIFVVELKIVHLLEC